MPSDVNVAAAGLISRVQTTLFTRWAKFYDTNDAVKPLDKLESRYSNTHLREHKELETGGMLQTCGTRHKAHVGLAAERGLARQRVTSRSESLV
jgi:hypothetical protein